MSLKGIQDIKDGNANFNHNSLLLKLLYYNKCGKWHSGMDWNNSFSLL